MADEKTGPRRRSDDVRGRDADAEASRAINIAALRLDQGAPAMDDDQIRRQGDTGKP